MLDFIKEMYNDLSTYKSYVTESLEPIFKSKNQMSTNQTLNIVTESDDPKTQCFEDFKKYSKDNSHIHPLDHVKTHTGKKDTYLLFATADSVNGSYKPLIEGLKKNVKYNGNDADWHSIYLPGDVFLAIKVGKEITESTEVKDKKVKNIIFDFGAVLVDYKSDAEFLKAFEPYRLSKSEIDTLRKIYFDFVPNDETASLEDSVYCYKKKLPENLQKYAVKAFEVFSTNNKPFDYTVPILKDLKRKGYKIYYLSNWGRASFTLMKDHHIMDFINLFNGGIVSYEVGFTKPHKEIYQLLIKKYNLDPSECIFYDDKKENCEAARKEGMRSVLFSHDIVNEILQLPNLNAEIRESYNELYLDALSIVEDGTEYDYNFNIDVDDITLEAATDTHIMMENLYPKVSDILSTPVGDRKFKQMVGAFMDRNSMKLHTAGPTYLVPFADRDKAEFFNLFKLDQKYVKKLIKDVTDKIGSGSQFKLLSDNPIYWVFYCCIRYYTMKKDTKGLNTALSIYALSNYPSVFHMSFPYPPNAAVMQYTMDNLSEKYIMKQAGHVFGGLFLSIQHSYEFLKPYMADASDKEIIRFIQRIRNDQKSMMKNICDQYMKNHAAGRRVKLNLDSHEGIQIDDDNENNTTVVQTVADNVVNRLITSGLDLRRVSQCKDIAQIGMADCRFYLSKIVTDKYVKEITAFIYSVLFLYLYDEKKTKQDINSTYFLKWSAELFRKTNSNNPNIRNIKETLDKWGEETGVHAKFKREASRVNYKKAIFWYFILSIQYYNK